MPSATPPPIMQRSSSRNNFTSVFIAKNGVVDRQKLGLIVLCSFLVLYIFYDFCSDIHQAQYAASIQRTELQMRNTAGVGSTRGDSLTGASLLPTSPGGMFKTLDSAKLSFVNDAGLLAFPIQPEHLASKLLNAFHVGTILPGMTRGNHLHRKNSEVIVLVQGSFLLHTAQIGNDGKWSAEEYIFEVGLTNNNPFAQQSTITSATPIGFEIPPNTCHALRNLSPSETAVFTTYYVAPMDAAREEPERETCKANVAYLAPAAD